MEIIDFLKESNAIEREYSDRALTDSITAWQYAYKKIIKKGELMSTDVVKGIHKRLMKNLNPEISGKLRKIQVGVMTKEGFKEAIHHSKIKEELMNWSIIFNKNIRENYKDWKGNHIWFEKIHPFEDGNGRTGRILMNLQRLKMKLPLLIIHEGAEQQEYYNWFKQTALTKEKSQ